MQVVTSLRDLQEGRGGLVPPYLQVRNAAGKWVTVLDDMGMPAGKPKTIVLDLTGKWLSASRQVRVVTNLCVLDFETAEHRMRLRSVHPGVTVDEVARPSRPRRRVAR